MSFQSKDIKLLSSIILFWIVMVLLVDVHGNFPINDDWSYSYSVKTLVEDGKLEFTGWISMPVISQIYWGSLFCSMSGFSFEILRLSTLLLGIVGIFFCYLIFSEVTNSLFLKFLTTSLIALNPIYFLLSATFMTDIPFFTTSTISIFFFIKYLKKQNKYNLLLGILTIIIASFIRQVGILVLISFAITSLLQKENTLYKKLYPIILVLLLFAGFYLFQFFVHSAIKDPMINNTRMGHFFNSFTLKNFLGLIPLIKNTLFVLTYIGLFLFPFLVYHFYLMLKSNQTYYKTINLIVFIALTFIPFTLMIVFNKTLPLRPNTLWKYGLGPATLKDVDILELNHIGLIPESIWILLTFIGIAGSVLIGFTFFYFFKNKKATQSFYSNNLVKFIFVNTALNIILLGFADFYDRYIIQLLPGILFLIFSTYKDQTLIQKHFTKNIAIVVLIGLTLFTIYETHTYFAWNRSRWQALDYLTNDLNISPKRIDGGFEFNAWNFYDPNYERKKDKSWWWVQDDEYIITFGTLEGYEVFKAYDYNSFCSKNSIYILKRISL
jgi:hypothetical protein